MKSAAGVFVTPILATFVATLTMCIVLHEVSSTQFIGVLFTYTIVGPIFAVISALLLDGHFL